MSGRGSEDAEREVMLAAENNTGDSDVDAGESLSSLKSSSSTDTGAVDKCSPKELAITLVVCTVYMVVGPLLIMLNKYLLTTGRFHYPILLTTMHQVSSSFCCAVLIKGMACVPLQHEVTWKVWRTNIFAVGLTTTAALCTGNASYLYLTVAFVEILKGFTPVVTMMVQSLFGEPLPSCRIASCVLLISLGTAISSFGERMNLTGLLLMLGSVYCEATRLISPEASAAHELPVREPLLHVARIGAMRVCGRARRRGAEFKMGLPRDAARRIIPDERLPRISREWCVVCAQPAAGRRGQAFTDTQHAHTFVRLRTVVLPRVKRTNVVMRTPRHQPQRLLLAGILLFADHVSRIQFCGYAISLFFFSIYNYLLVTNKG